VGGDLVQQLAHVVLDGQELVDVARVGVASRLLHQVHNNRLVQVKHLDDLALFLSRLFALLNFLLKLVLGKYIHHILNTDVPVILDMVNTVPVHHYVLDVAVHTVDGLKPRAMHQTVRHAVARRVDGAWVGQTTADHVTRSSRHITVVAHVLVVVRVVDGPSLNTTRAPAESRVALSAVHLVAPVDLENK